MKIDDFKIIEKLTKADLDLMLLSEAGSYKSQVYKSHSEFHKSGIVMALPDDEFYLLNKHGEVEFIGSLEGLNNFCNKI